MTKKIKQPLSPAVQSAFQNYQEGFLQVLGALQTEGVDLHQGKPYAAVGLTKVEFNKCTLASAKAMWDKACDLKAKGEMDSWSLGFTVHSYLRAFPNAYECLEITKAGVNSDAGFAVLGVTKAEFEATCREAILIVLRKFPEHTEVSKSGVSYASGTLFECMRAARIDPEQDEIFQEGGFVSRADFDEKLAGWKKAAAARPKDDHHCCGGGHDHSVEQPPAPGS